MNTFKKILPVTVAIVIASGFAATAPAQAASAFEVSLPSVASLIADAGKTIAAELSVYFRAASEAPKSYAKRKSPSVHIAQIETVVVEASRLPANLELEGIEHIVVVASRLPPLEQAPAIVVASRL